MGFNGIYHLVFVAQPWKDPPCYEVNHLFLWVIFQGYVKSPQGIYIYTYIITLCGTQTEQVQYYWFCEVFERGIGFEGRRLGVKTQSNNIKHTHTHKWRVMSYREWTNIGVFFKLQYTNHREANDFAKSTLQGSSALFRCLVPSSWYKYDRYE